MRKFHFWRLSVQHRKYFSMLLLFNLIVGWAIAQVHVSGKVTDGDGKPLPAISVQLKGKKAGTATDLNGTYNLVSTLKPGAYTLVFTGVGYEPKEYPLIIESSSATR